MGTIDTVINKEADLTIKTAVGKISAQDILAELRNYYKGVTTRFILWDFTNADLAHVTSDEVQDIVDLARTNANSRIGGRTATVFSSDSGFGLGRMYDIKQEVTGPQVVFHMSFKDKAKALEWLKEN